MNARPRSTRHISLSSVKGFDAHRCEVVSVGYGFETDARKYSYDNRTRQKFSLFQYTLGGEGRFRAGATGVEEPLGRRRGFLANCPSETWYWLPEGGEWEFLYILFVGDMARFHVEQLIAARGHVVELPLTSPPVELLRRTYSEAAAGTLPDKFQLSARLYQLLMELYRPRSSPGSPTQIESAVLTIEQSYGDAAFTIEALAKKMSVSRFHFSRLFRKQTGLSPYACLTQFRMNRAMDYLISTQTPTKEISRMVGFNDYSYFCRMFRQATGTTPSRVRRSQK